MGKKREAAQEQNAETPAKKQSLHDTSRLEIYETSLGGVKGGKGAYVLLEDYDNGNVDEEHIAYEPLGSTRHRVYGESKTVGNLKRRASQVSVGEIVEPDLKRVQVTYYKANRIKPGK